MVVALKLDARKCANGMSSSESSNSFFRQQFLYKTPFGCIAICPVVHCKILLDEGECGYDYIYTSMHILIQNYDGFAQLVSFWSICQTCTTEFQILCVFFSLILCIEKREKHIIYALHNADVTKPGTFSVQPNDDDDDETE